MAFSLVWSLGYLISIIVFSTVIGLIFYFNETSKKDLAKYLFVSVICTFAMIYVMGLFKDQLYSAIGIYNYALLFLIAFILILIGYLLSKEKTFKGKQPDRPKQQNSRNNKQQKTKTITIQNHPNENKKKQKGKG